MQKYDARVREFEEWARKPTVDDLLKPAVDSIAHLFLLANRGVTYVRGPVLRDAMPKGMQTQKKREMISSCVPKFIRLIEAEDIDAYVPTLLGMLVSSMARPVVEVLAWAFDAIATIKREYVLGERGYTPKRLLMSIQIEPGSYGKSSEPSFVARVLATAFAVRLHEGEAWLFDIPTDIEELSECGTFTEFIEHCLKKAAPNEPGDTGNWRGGTLRHLLIRGVESDTSRSTNADEASGDGATGRAFVGRWAWMPGRRIGDGGQGHVYVADRIADPKEVIGRCREIKHALSTALARVLREDPNVGQLADNCVAPIQALFLRGSMPSGPPEYALKVFGSGDVKRAGDLLERFRLEVHALQVSRVGCVHIVDHGIENDETLWAVYPLFRRGNLESHRLAFKGNPIGALLATRSMLRGLIQLHADELVHRDLKPENIFVDDAGELVIGDLGLVRRVNQESGVTSLNESIGNRRYTPMWDQFDKGALSDPKWDVYSIGKLLHHLIHAGAKPVSGQDHRIPEYDLERIAPGPITAAVNDILDGCLKPARRDVRFATALELDAALQRIMEKYAVASVGTGVH